MGRGLILLVVSALAQQQQEQQQPPQQQLHRPWNRLGGRLGLRADTPRPLVNPSAVDAAPATVCAEDEVICTEAMQRQGMNCVVGACVKLPDTRRASLGSIDANGCQKGGGYSWCATKSKCLRAWEEPCEEPAAPSRPALGGARDANGCVQGGGYSWCESKQKCLRHWEEPCEEDAPRPERAPMGATKDEHGCVLGGGFQWCEHKQKCLRQWEEPCEEQTDPTSMLRNFVGKHLTPEQRAKMDNVMGDIQSKQAHFRDTIQQKITQFKDKMGDKSAVPQSEVATMGASKDEHGCVLGGGFQWCEHKQKCLRQWEEPCGKEENVGPLAGAAKDEHGCVLGGGFQWCEHKQKCLRQWEEPCEQAEPSLETTLLDIVSKHLTPEQQTKMDKVVVDMKAKQARFRESIQEKIAEFKEKKMGGQFEAALRARMRSRADGKSARPQEKIGAHEDNRVPVSEAVKNDAIVDSVM